MDTKDLIQTYINDKNLGASKTAAEICQQPEVWREVIDALDTIKAPLSTFMDTAFNDVDYIIFTGAGTSAFIGLSLHGLYFRETGLISQAVATTDIASQPADYFDGQHKVLVISFARSGNSPESIAALELADSYAKYCYHLIITCDKSGALAGFQSRGQRFLFTLPEKANDKGLAMTSSYSGMLLAAVAILYLKDTGFLKKQLSLLSKKADQILVQSTEDLARIARLPYTRAVFLGPFFGTATEAGLKLQELTSGKIICKSDSYLGFRHGPKAVLNNTTLLVFFLSPEKAVRRYEQDLIRTIIEETAGSLNRKSTDKGQLGGRNQTPLMHGVFIHPGNFSLARVFNLTLGSEGRAEDDLTRLFSSIPDCLEEDHEQLDPRFWPVTAILPGQLLGLFSAIALGIPPDSPSPSGAISRVVQGVTIYRDIDREKDRARQVKAR